MLDQIITASCSHASGSGPAQLLQVGRELAEFYLSLQAEYLQGLLSDQKEFISVWESQFDEVVLTDYPAQAKNEEGCPCELLEGGVIILDDISQLFFHGLQRCFHFELRGHLCGLSLLNG